MLGQKTYLASSLITMAPQLYLITPTTSVPDGFTNTVMSVLSVAEFSAILVTRGGMDEKTYANFAQQLVNVGQGAGCAVLVENDVALAKRIGADGVHITEGPDALAAAIKALKPAMIVGAGDLHSRHDAMTAGEMDVDYVMFGNIDGTADAEAAELAQWWAETFEVPAIFSQADANGETADARGAEFIALSKSIWDAEKPANFARDIAIALGAAV
jgi:thiamine-phosphate pyrophosphorylase